MSNGLPVSDDIIDRILSLSPTFSSLKSTILTCKSFYRVFQTHPKSIVRAVAFNITGPALPQALECIRHPDIEKYPNRIRRHAYWGESDEDEEDEDVEDDEADEDSPNAKKQSANEHSNKQIFQSQETNLLTDHTGDLSSAPITPAETYKIIEDAKVVAHLEDIFSFRYVDRSSSTSQLSQSESRDFRIAIYQLMLYNSIFHPGTWNLGVSSDSENEDKSDIGNQTMFEKRKQFLSRYSTPELLRLHSVAQFLKEILLWCVRGGNYHPDICDLALAVGPACIVECYDNQDRGIEPLEDMLEFFEEEMEFQPRVAAHFFNPLVKNLEARNIKSPPSDFTHWVSISSRVTERNTQCDRCLQSYGFDIFSRSTFVEYVDCSCPRLVHAARTWKFYDWQNISACLKNNLRYNRLESEGLCQEAKKIGSSLLVRIWEDLWNWNLVKQQSQDQQSSPLPDWTEDSYLCGDCFRSFLIENLWLWWRHLKANSGPLEENCWYGYNCRTQTHKPEHAKKLNHLCEQTRF